jgi:hypothetical protein
MVSIKDDSVVLEANPISPGPLSLESFGFISIEVILTEEKKLCR